MPGGKCVFCNTEELRDRPFHEYEHFYSLWDIHPVSPGHSFIVPRRHVLQLEDLTDEEWAALKQVIRETKRIMGETDLRALYEEMEARAYTKKSPWFCRKMLESGNLEKKPDGYHIGDNEGEAAGMTVHHLHIHVIPRFIGDVENAEGGIRNIIPGMGGYN